MSSNRITGKILTRNTNLKAPKGFKTVLVIGVLTVPETAPMGGNMVSAVTGSLDSCIDKNEALEIANLTVKGVKLLPKKMRCWNAEHTLSEEFKLDSSRDYLALEPAQKALNLIAKSNFKDPEFPALIKQIKIDHQNLPLGDGMQQVLNSILKVYEKRIAE